MTLASNFGLGGPDLIIVGLFIIVALVLLVGCRLLIRSTPAHLRKPLGGLFIVVGAFLILFALLRMNSAASQLAQAVGGRDDVPALCLVGGIPCALLGVWIFFSSRPSPRTQSQAPSRVPASSDTLLQLERLAKLRESGALSQAEFETQKKQLLG